ncbi:MAG TPA: hypothetical protein VL981_03810 [Candidatus Methylacidiphilales bacterium]|nr:hypothetical protein [Candidatus Methylacidiphilales bacterium]
MKHWALIVAALYFAILVILTFPVILLAFMPGVKLRQAAEAYSWWPYWLWLAVMVISQFTLLTVPVRVASRRPVTRGSVWRTVLATSLMAGGLAIGALLSLGEFVYADQFFNYAWQEWSILILALLTWCVWSLIFIRMSGNTPPADLVTRQCRWLFKGSILELLIAVPAHIVARWRDYCCAGIWTFIGLTTGISVMLFAFGPAVLFLFMERWKRLHPAEQTGS